MAPATTHLLTLALLVIGTSGSDPAIDPPKKARNLFPPGFPFNMPGLAIPGVLPAVSPPYKPDTPGLPQLSTSKADGVFTTLPAGPGGPIDPSCLKTQLSYSVVTHISTTVISYTNTISSLETLTNSICAPVLPTLLPPISTTESAGGVFTTPSFPGGPFPSVVTLTTVVTSKVTVTGEPLPTVPTGPIATLPTISGGPLPTVPAGPIATLPTISGEPLPTVPTGPIAILPPTGPGVPVLPTSKSPSSVPPPAPTYPSSGPPAYPPPAYPPPAYNPPSYGNGP